MPNSHNRERSHVDVKYPGNLWICRFVRLWSYIPGNQSRFLYRTYGCILEQYLLFQRTHSIDERHCSVQISYCKVEKIGSCPLLHKQISLQIQGSWLGYDGARLGRGFNKRCKYSFSMSRRRLCAEISTSSIRFENKTIMSDMDSGLHGVRVEDVGISNS